MGCERVDEVTVKEDGAPRGETEKGERTQRRQVPGGVRLARRRGRSKSRCSSGIRGFRDPREEGLGRLIDCETRGMDCGSYWDGS